MGNRVSLPAAPTHTTPADERQYWRAEADRHAKERNSFYQRSQEAYKRRHGAEAKQLSIQGKRADQAMREANRRAATAAFQANNRVGVRDSDTLDLHDLYVEEALACLRTRLGEARQEGLEHLVVVYGQGHHSAGGVQRLKPAVEAFLTEQGLEHVPGRPNPGCVWVELGAAAPPARGFFGRLKSLLRRMFPGAGMGMCAAGYGG